MSNDNPQAPKGSAKVFGKVIPNSPVAGDGKLEPTEVPPTKAPRTNEEAERIALGR